MPLFQPVVFDDTFNVRFVRGSTAAALESAVNAALADIYALSGELVGVTLAGAGDGHVFVARLDYEVGPEATAIPDLQVQCYEASTEDALYAAFEARTATTRAAGNLELYSQMSAGSARGDLFVGMCLLAPMGAIPSLVIDNVAGFGFPYGSPNLIVAANVNFSTQIQAVSPANDPALDPGTGPLFELGTGADLGKLRFVGPAAVPAQILLGIDSFLTASGPSNTTFSMLRNGVAIARSRVVETNNNSVQLNIAKTQILQPGDLLDAVADQGVTVERYHYNVSTAANSL